MTALNGMLGGSWNPANHSWESRRDSMLDAFGKAQPFTMKPTLQINGKDARVLVKALSGRWSYEQGTVWDSIANAFSLCIDRIDPGAPPPGPSPTITWGKFDARLPFSQVGARGIRSFD